ncbi:amylo-alpha-1,6-glucosidase [Propionivibrio soli]|uniref:amylo-alpha-1,6-glucosidase n=1 Tax=Propionivibrio soli TaxID=2976531 RepID=UPI0021E78123|nr:amylo-alpha-1,6-glucosidase [Propionivibrio soli]
MTDPLQSVVHSLPILKTSPAALTEREWLVTNGIGGYASSSLPGLATRKYHGLLVSALPNPLGRTVMLNHLAEYVTPANGARVQLSGEELSGRRLALPGVERLRDFRLEGGLPVWEFDLDGATLEKRVVMPYRQNTVVIAYRLTKGDAPMRLELRPAMHFRHYENDVTESLQPGYRLTLGETYEVACDNGPAVLRLWICGEESSFIHNECELTERHYRMEENRGYGHEGRLWSPGLFSFRLAPQQTAAIVASTESTDTMFALSPDEALAAEHERRRKLLVAAPELLRQGAAAQLVLAADQFVITPVGRRRDAARAVAEGDEMRSIIAGYHWFTDWGRDTMISLEGLTLSTGRIREAAGILRTFAHYVRDGLLPNMFPDGSNEGLYHTADATLWFFHALDRYYTLTGDDTLLTRLLPTMTDIAEKHLAGTRFNIGVDPEDGLLHQGSEGYQLTWMDAKCDGWVVTPRRGKAVEINALWHNALSVLSAWSRRLGQEARAERWAGEARKVRESFNRRFWYEAGGYLYDVVDGPDGDSTECRPNQVFAVSLPNPVLDQSRWSTVLKVVEERLVTPYGLRSLAPGSEHYAPQYFGNLRQRDAAYHQGTVWAWLIGPWLDAWRKVHPEAKGESGRWLQPLIAHLDEFGVGSIAEIFDAEPPHTPRGCIAQAWSIGEVLRQLAACKEYRADATPQSTSP